MTIRELKKEPSREVIKTLEELLGRAKNGEITGLVVAAVEDGGMSHHVIAGSLDYGAIALALMDMHWRCMQRRHDE